MTIVRIEDARALRYCTTGLQRGAARWGLNFRDFIRNGIEADRLPQDDPMIQRMIAQAKLREKANGEG